jgi:hypothetical protein
MLFVFTTVSVEITVKEDLKMEAASLSETLTTNYQSHGVIIIIFCLVTTEDFSSFQPRCCTCFEYFNRQRGSFYKLSKIRS